jgi:hypothetical protein
MNVEIAAQFPDKEYINGGFRCSVGVCLPLIDFCGSLDSNL